LRPISRRRQLLQLWHFKLVRKTFLLVSDTRRQESGFRAVAALVHRNARRQVFVFICVKNAGFLVLIGLTVVLQGVVFRCAHRLLNLRWKLRLAVKRRNYLTARITLERRELFMSQSIDGFKTRVKRALLGVPSGDGLGARRPFDADEVVESCVRGMCGCVAFHPVI